MTSYEWWYKALAGAELGGADCPIHEGEPQLGFFRFKSGKTGNFMGLAIFAHDNLVLSMSGTRRFNPEETKKFWLYAAKRPITEEFYRAWESTGKWPDEAEHAVPAPSLPSAPRTEATPASEQPTGGDGEEIAQIGDNQPKELDPESIEGVTARIAELELDLKKYEKIETDEAAQQAQSLRASLNDLSNKADKLRKAEADPHYTKYKAINDAWNPLVKRAKDAANKIKSAIEAHLDRKRKKEREEAAKRAADEAARLAAEEAARKEASQSGGNLEETVVAPPPPPPPPPPPVQVQATTIKGGRGRAASVGTKKVATVTDQDAAYQALKALPIVIEAIAKAAQQAADAGNIDIPGVKIEEKSAIK